MPPCFASAKINDNDTITAFLAGISDVAHALSRRGNSGAQVEADIVDITVGVRDIGWEYDCLEDGIVGQVNTNEFGPANTGKDIGSIWHRCTAGVQDPKTVKRIDDHTLDANEVVFVISTRGGAGGIVDCALE